MRKNKNHRWVILATAAAGLLLLGICMLPAGPTFARVGGGEHFPGGGESGGGDDSGLFQLILIIFYLIPFPYNVILVVIVIVAAAVAQKRRKSGGIASTARLTVYSAPAVPPMPPAPTVAPPASLSELKQRDPNFSEQQFEDLVSTAFFKVQEAWAKRDMSSARPFLSPAIFQRFETQLAELKKKGWTNRIENLVIGAVELVEAAHDGGVDYLTAQINAAAADYTVDDKTGQIVGGNREVRRFSEYWTFLRSDQVQTSAGKTEPVSQKCPNCGAPISLNAAGKCDYCGSEITSGKFSWVLSEISQPSVWRPRPQAVRPGNISPLGSERYVLGIVQCPACGANVQDLAGITAERCWRCGATVTTAR